MGSRGPWADARLRAAWARGDYGAVFREYRRAAGGISQSALGSLVGLPQSRVSVIERGRHRVTSAEVMRRIREGLHVPEELGGVPARRELSAWDPPPELRDRVAHAHRTHRTDLRTADYIRRVLAEHRRAEDVVGGRDLWPVVRSQLDTVTGLLPHAAGDAADGLLVLAAEHGHWLSWVAWQHQRRGPALAWLDIARGWAADAGSADMLSWLGRVRSYYLLADRDPLRALRTAEAARYAPTPLTAAAAAVATHTAAMAAAAVGERDRARRLADEARALADRDDAERRPPWLYWMGPTRARLMHADTAYAVQDWSTAAAELAAALPGLEGYPRDHAYYTARLEDARARA